MRSWQSGDPCSFDSTDNFTMAFVGAGLHGYHFSYPKDSQFANTEGNCTGDYTFDEKVCHNIDAIGCGIVEGIGELMESPDQVIAAAAIALGIEVGAMLEIPLIGKIMAVVGMVGVGVMVYQLRNEMEWINNDLERIQALAKYITKIIILAVVAISGVKAADVIVKQFTYPVMWSKAIDVVHENRIIRLLDSLEHNIDDIMTELYYSFSTALCSVDDIYAELATMVDDDALAYLQKKYGTPNPNQLKLFKDVADGIESTKEIIGRKLNQDETEYVCQKTADKVSWKKISKVFRFLADENQSDFLEGESIQYLKERYSDASSFKNISEIIDSAVSASEAKGKCLNLSDIRYLVKAVTAKVPQKTINEMIEGTSSRKTYYTVQKSKDAQRLLGNGTPWKTEPKKAHLGEGVYAWGNKEDAEIYLDICIKNGAEDAKIMEFEVLESDFNKMRKKFLAGCSDDEVNEFLDKYSTLYGTSPVKKHNFDYISRSAGMADEHYFNKTIFARIRFK